MGSSAQRPVPSPIERLKNLYGTLEGIDAETYREVDVGGTYPARLLASPPTEVDRAIYIVQSQQLDSFLMCHQSSVLLVTSDCEKGQEDVAITSMCAKLEDELRHNGDILVL